MAFGVLKSANREADHGAASTSTFSGYCRGTPAGMLPTEAHRRQEMAEFMRGWGAMLIAALIAAVLAVVGTTPPRPAGADASATSFSATRAMRDVRTIARAPHPVGSAEHAQVVGALEARLRSLGLKVAASAYPLSAKGAATLKRQGGTAAPARIVNLSGVLPGRDRTLPALLLMAHHDSVVGSPGAPDDAAGVAAILEIVRALRAGGRPLRDVVVLFTDGEELGLEGATAFFGRDPLAARVGMIINLEARGGGGRTSMFETGPRNGAAMRLFAGAVRRPVATSLGVFVYRLLPNSTDLTPALEAGKPGFNFAFVGRPGLYHSPLATPDALDRGSLQDMGRQALDLSRALADAPQLPGQAPDLVFFDLFGLVFVHYPARFGWLPLGAAAGLIAAAGWRRGGIRDGARGAFAVLALAVLAGLLLLMGNLVSGADGPINYYDRLAAIPLLQVQTLLLALGALAAAATLVGRRSGVASVWAGAAAVPLLLGVAAQALAPTAAFPMAVAVLAASIAAVARSRIDGVAGTAIAVVAAAIGTGYLLALSFFLLQGVGGSGQIAAVLPLVLAAPILLPLAPSFARRRLLSAAGLLIVAGMAVALWVRLDPVAASVPAYSTFR